MADRKITDLTALAAGSQATGDLLTIVDVSEGAAADKNKKITVESLFKGIPSNVGIGTTSPGSNLDIEEDGASANAELAINYAGSGSGRTSAIRFQRGGSNFAYIAGATFALTSGNNDDLAIAPVSGKNLLFGIGNSEKARIDSSGNVGVGTASPSELLHTVKASGTSRVRFEASASHSFARLVAGSTSYNSGVEFFSGSTNTANITAQGGGELVVEANGSERMRINSSGQVGINASSPGRTLDVDGVIRSDGTSGSFELGGNSSTPSVGCAIHRPANNTMAFVTGTSERLRIDSSGRLLIGLTSSTGSHALEVNGGTDNEPIKVESSDAGAYVRFEDNDTTGSTRLGAVDNDFKIDVNSAERMKINSSGQFFVSGVYSFTSSNAANVHVFSDGLLVRSTSSIKYKTDVETLQDSYADNILNCRPVWYRSSSSLDKKDWGYWGFIAEEVAEIDPRLVNWKTTDISYDENGSTVETPCDPEPEGVQYDRFVPHLLNLIKRQQSAIETLEAKVAALEAG